MVVALRGGEMAAGEAQRCLPPLGGLAVSSRAAALPGSPAVSEDALSGAPVQVGEGFCRQSLESDRVQWND